MLIVADGVYEFTFNLLEVIPAVDPVPSPIATTCSTPVPSLITETKFGEEAARLLEFVAYVSATVIAIIQSPVLVVRSYLIFYQNTHTQTLFFVTLGEMKFPESKIGEVVAFPGEWASQLKAAVHPVATTPAPVASAPPPIAGPIPVPPRIPDKIRMRMKK